MTTKDAFKIYLNALGDYQAKKIKAEAKILGNSILATPAGKERMGDKGICVGDTVKFTQTATRKGTAKVAERYKQNGFVYFVMEEGDVHRLKDVEKVEN